jgi:hypothetical protein
MVDFDSNTCIGPDMDHYQTIPKNKSPKHQSLICIDIDSQFHIVSTTAHLDLPPSIAHFQWRIVSMFASRVLQWLPVSVT